MSYIEAYYKLNQIFSDSGSIDVGRQIPDGSTTYSLVLLGHTLNFIDSWIQSFEGNCYNETMMYRDKIGGLFKKITFIIPEPKP